MSIRLGDSYARTKIRRRPTAHVSAPTGSAVGDLQYLDKNSDLLQNFDALDAMDGDDDADSSN